MVFTINGTTVATNVHVLVSGCSIIIFAMICGLPVDKKNAINIK